MGKQVESVKKTGAEKTPRKTENVVDQQANLDMFPMPSRETIKPEQQLSLTETELEEEIPQMLTTNNPNAPHNVTRFHSKEKCFKLEAMVEQCAIHYATDGWLLHKNSEAGKKQIENERLASEAMTKAEAELLQDGTKKDGEESKQLRNQFNYSDRACQTMHANKKNRSCYTEPPPTTVRNGSCTQWDIYDEYCRDIEKQKIQEQQYKKNATNAKKTKNQPIETSTHEVATSSKEQREALSLRAAKVMERMTMQNIFDEIIMDLKYWDDTSDSFRPDEGSMLPLWKFQDRQTNEKSVTALCSNTRHGDVFAVGYGSYDAIKQTRGVISVYSLKNPSVPEKIAFCESGVLSVAFHPDYPNLLAVGCYDGSIRVFDTKDECQNPLYLSNSGARHHTEAVWQLCWKSGTLVGELQLFSASADGTIGLWTFTRSEMLFQVIMSNNTSPSQTVAAPPQTKNALLCLDFNKVRHSESIGSEMCVQMDETTYIVGSGQGTVYRYSTEYDSEYLDVYPGHELPVYAVKWNFFHPYIFLSASEDWTVKLWDSRAPHHPITTIELTSPVTSIAWAPYSSTVFVAVTDAGKVYAFDLSMNRYLALCEQKVISKGRLTHVLFHPTLPLILVGDSTGLVSSMKLSPNLRKDACVGVEATQREPQMDKLNQVLEQLKLSASEAQ